MPHPWEQYPLLQYLSQLAAQNGTEDRLPPLKDVGEALGWSITRVREELAVAKALGLVEARPRIGLRRLPYTFTPAVSLSLHYALQLDREGYFQQFADLRKKTEATYFIQAARLLTSEDKNHLKALVRAAWEQLRGQPIHIPHQEHRDLHLTIYRRLDNVFVRGILEAYWDAYESVGYNRYTDYDYLSRVWEYHQRIVEAICAGEYEKGHQALLEHTELLYHRPHVTVQPLENNPRMNTDDGR